MWVFFFLQNIELSVHFSIFCIHTHCEHHIYSFPMRYILMNDWTFRKSCSLAVRAVK